MPEDALDTAPPRSFDSVRDLLSPGTLYARIALGVTAGLVALLTIIVVSAGISGHDHHLVIGGSIGALLGGGLFIYLPMWLVISPSIRRLRRAAVDGVRCPGRVLAVSSTGGRTPQTRYQVDVDGKRQLQFEAPPGTPPVAVGDTLDVFAAPNDPRAVAVLLRGQGLIALF